MKLSVISGGTIMYANNIFKAHFYIHKPILKISQILDFFGPWIWCLEYPKEFLQKFMTCFVIS